MTMTFTAAETGYLKDQPLGRLATVQPDGTLQVSPVGFHYNEDLATIDIGGYNMTSSRKFRNVAENGRVAPGRPAGGNDAIIRIHPRRIISFGIDDPDREPHLLTPSKRNVS